MNVALSLNYAWRDYARRKQVQEQSWGDDQQLRSWAGEQGNQLWRLCAELTMFEGWRPANAGAGEFAVALLASRASDPCRRALRVLFEEMGVEVAAEDDWLVQDFDEFPHDADFGQVRDLLRSQSFGPIERCLAATEERGGGVPDVAIGGQRLTAAILYMVARKQGCRTLFATDPGDIRGGANSPVLWQLQEGGNAEELSLVYRPRDDTGDRQAVVAEEQIFLPATEARAV